MLYRGSTFYFSCCVIACSFIICMPAVLAAEKPFGSFLDHELQQQVDATLRANKQWRTLIRKKKMSVCVLDMQSDKPKLASVNGNKMMYAASLPKIAILLAAYVSFEDGSLQETPEVKQDLADMIRVSSNSAATRMIDRIGFKKIRSVLQDPKYHFYQKNRGGGLWVGKRYASKGSRYGDPLFQISHGATANQVCRFYYLVASGQLINKHRSEQMLSDLGNPKLHHKFVSQIDKLAPKASVYRKSGSWRQWHADSVLVRGVNWRDYILVALVESTDGEQIIRDLVPSIEGILSPKM